MGSGEEWANDGSCWLTLAGVAASGALVGFAFFVIVSDLVIG